MSRELSSVIAGTDAVVDTTPRAQQWPELVHLHGTQAGHLWLIVVPDMTHHLVQASEAADIAKRSTRIVPDMADDDRRVVAERLRAGEIEYLFVSPERFLQKKFVQFMQSLAPSQVVVASAQRCNLDASDCLEDYATLRSLRALLPDAPILALLDEPQGGVAYNAVIATLSLRVKPLDVPLPQEKATATTVKTAAPTPAVVPPLATLPPNVPKVILAADDPMRLAFPYFEREEALSMVAEALDRDSEWCGTALERYIEESGRTTPFPWIDRPTYLMVAMVAGQAETLNPAIIGPIVGKKVSQVEIRLIVSTLRNRSTGRPAHGK